jgi:hypothetical protein
MDIDRAREIRRECVVFPVIIGEPVARFGHCHEIAAPAVVDAPLRLRGLIQNQVDSRFGFKDGAHFGFKRAVIEIDVGDLVVRDREDPAGAAVERLQTELVLDRQPAVAAKQAVEVDGRVDFGDAIFGEDGDLDGALLEEVDEVADEVVDLVEVTFG